MNDNPLPGSKRAVLIFISVLILFSFSVLSLGDWEDEDYLSGDERLCFGVKSVPSNMLKVFFKKRITFRHSMLTFAVSRNDECFLEKEDNFSGLRECFSNFVVNHHILNLRC